MTEVQFQGTARSAKAAYEFFNAVTGDGDLQIYAWSMERPGIDDDGRANFAVKGKMR